MGDFPLPNLFGSLVGAKLFIPRYEKNIQDGAYVIITVLGAVQSFCMLSTIDSDDNSRIFLSPRISTELFVSA